MPRHLTIQILAEGAIDRRGKRHRRNPASCKFCGQKVLWCETAAGKPMLFDENPDPIQTSEDGRTETVSTEHVHFGTCKEYQRRPQGEEPARPAWWD